MYKRRHHQLIDECLNNFNSKFLTEHHILFGGGTRICLEIDEYRESVDIDFLCQDKRSYRAVREQATNRTLGELVLNDFDYAREIMCSRDAVRTLLNVGDTKIKLEFVCFDNYDLSLSQDKERFPVPFLDHTSCFYTKLLANADRAGQPPFKDILDILMMINRWGTIPTAAFDLARSHYGAEVDRKLRYSLQHFDSNKVRYKEQALDMGVNEGTFTDVIAPTASSLLAQIA